MNPIFIQLNEIKKLFPPRKPDTNKYDYGHILIIAGSLGMSGAAILTAQSALRSGAGLVTLAIPKSLLGLVAGQTKEIMTLPLPETRELSLALSAGKKILQFIKNRRVSVVAIGPGISRHRQTKKLVRKILLQVNRPCVLDADGINAFVGSKKLLKKVKSPLVLTPHCGELARLLEDTTERIQIDRIRSARSFAQEYGQVCVLKGHQTVVTDGRKTFLNPTGNPGMATAGCGDVLTGMIAGFLGQGLSLLSASLAAVYLHGLAGDIARDEKTELGLIAGDIIDYIPRAIKKIL